MEECIGTYELRPSFRGQMRRSRCAVKKRPDGIQLRVGADDCNLLAANIAHVWEVVVTGAITFLHIETKEPVMLRNKEVKHFQLWRIRSNGEVNWTRMKEALSPLTVERVSRRFMAVSGNTWQTYHLAQDSLLQLSSLPHSSIAFSSLSGIVCERVSNGMRYCDISFMAKEDNSRTELQFVPAPMLTPISQAARKCDVPVIMLPMSLNWRYLWKLIADDQEWFNEQGGWRQLQPQADEIDEEDEKLDAKEPLWHPTPNAALQAGRKKGKKATIGKRF